jgi:transposase
VDKLLTMSKKEWTRKEIMQRLEAKSLKQKEAAEMLQISERHVRRLLRNYRTHGPEGLISKRRGRPSNNTIPQQTRRQVIDLLHSRYADFGPTLACEKLSELHGLELSAESIRKLMIAEGLWKARRRRKAQVHQLRPRRACVGELVQIDGSPHAWFEDRGPTCTCLIAVDDASGRLMAMHFVPTETTFGYFDLTRAYLTQHGLPQAFYSDKNSIFRVNQPQTTPGDGLSQFGRALFQLDIEIICANTPQAKGRVERSFQTLQDRLVKEFRLQDISDIDQANAFAPVFIADYNHRFAVQPRSSHDAHRSLNFSHHELDLIFSLQETRTISKNLTVQYKKVLYQIQTKRPSYALRNALVTVAESPHGQVTILYKGKPLDYSIFHQQPRQAEIVPTKQLNAHLEKHHPKPAPNHPWRNYGQRLNGKPTPHKQDVPS